jgi:hypothetical protein
MNDNVGLIETALHDALMAKKRAPLARGTFWASSFGMCPRKQVAERAGLPPTRPTDMRGYFKMGTGTVIGKWVQDLLAEQGYLDPAFTERKFTYRSYVCRLDGYSDFDQAIVEIKTCDDNAIVRYPDVPEHYQWQCFLNARAAGVKKIILLQIGKNQGLTRTTALFLDEDWKAKIDTEIDRMEADWVRYDTTNELPTHQHRYLWEDKLCAYMETPMVHPTGVTRRVSG